MFLIRLLNIIILLFILTSCICTYAPTESTKPASINALEIPIQIITNEKLIELHDKAFDAGRKTIVYDDGNTYLVQNKRLGNKKYTESVSTKKEKPKARVVLTFAKK